MFLAVVPLDVGPWIGSYSLQTLPPPPLSFYQLSSSWGQGPHPLNQMELPWAYSWRPGHQTALTTKDLPYLRIPD